MPAIISGLIGAIEGASLTAKIITGVAALAVVGGGTAAIVINTRNDNQPEQEIVQTENEEQNKDEVDEEVADEEKPDETAEPGQTDTVSSPQPNNTNTNTSSSAPAKKTQYRYRDKEYQNFHANWYLDQCSTQSACEKLTKDDVGTGPIGAGYIFDHITNYGIVKNTGWEEYHSEWPRHSLAMSDSRTEQKEENGKTYIKTCYTKVEYVAYKWSSWSNWQDAAVSSNGSREVETRQLLFWHGVRNSYLIIKGEKEWAT
jgi:hypothetical protein